MFPAWRLQIREAQVAADSGRYDEAVALLEKQSLREYLPGKRLAQQMAGKMVERAEAAFARGDSIAAWRDLATADRLGGQSAAAARLRQEYLERALREVRRNMVAGQPQAALAELDQLQRRGMCGETARLYRQIAKLVQEADRAAAHGHFAQAAATLSQARDLIGKHPTDEGTMEIAQKLEVRAQQMPRPRSGRPAARSRAACGSRPSGLGCRAQCRRGGAGGRSAARGGPASSA